MVVFFLMMRRPPRSTQSRSSAASDVYKRQVPVGEGYIGPVAVADVRGVPPAGVDIMAGVAVRGLSLIHISEPTRPY